MDGTIGEIRYFAGNYAPRNWALCDGRILAINTNPALYSILGTTFGGNGSTTFALPDLRGRVPISPGTGPGLSTTQWGSTYGVEQITLQEGNLPAHAHSVAVQATTEAGNTTDPTGAVLADAGRFDNEFHDNPSGVPSVNMAATTTGSTGSALPIENRPPSLGVYAIICLQGTFPARN